MTIKQALMDRWTYGDAPRTAPLKAVLERAFDIHDKVVAEHDRLRGDANLSALGRQEALRTFIGAELAPNMRDIRAAVASARKALKDWRERLTPPPPDKTDAAGAVLRADVRRTLMEMRASERTGKLLKPDVDPLVVTAVLEMPAELLGIDPKVRETLMTTAIERAHPGALAAIEQTTEAVDLANVATRVALQTTATAGNFVTTDLLNEFVDSAVGVHKGAIIDREADRRLSAIATE